MFVEYCIEEINDMLFAAYAHGGDSGGPYGCEPEWMEKAINNFLKRANLEDTYEYRNVDRGCDYCRYFQVPQIVKKENINQTYGWE